MASWVQGRVVGEQKHVHVRCNKHSLRMGQSATNREGYGHRDRALVFMAQLPVAGGRPSVEIKAGHKQPHPARVL